MIQLSLVILILLIISIFVNTSKPFDLKEHLINLRAVYIKAASFDNYQEFMQYVTDNHLLYGLCTNLECDCIILDDYGNLHRSTPKNSYFYWPTITMILEKDVAVIIQEAITPRITCLNYIINRL